MRGTRGRLRRGLLQWHARCLGRPRKADHAVTRRALLRALRYTTSHLLELSRWHLLEYIDFITSTDCAHAALAAFGKQQLLHQVHFAVLCHGNTTADQALSNAQQDADR